MIHYLNELNLEDIKSDTLKEYIDFKNNAPDCILFFQIGSFFETYFEDAKILSENLGLNLGKRNFGNNQEIIQTGIPLNSVKLYIKQLLNKNYKIYLCEQLKDDNNKLYRKITRIYTQGTIIEQEFLESNENNYLATAYKTNNEILIAYGDSSTGEIYKSKGNFEEITNELNKIEPSEIIICEKQKKDFIELFPKYNIVYKKENYFKKENIEFTLINYCKDTQKEYYTDFEKIKEYKISNFLLLDNVTRKNLELTRTKRFQKKKGSLLYLLNSTKTPMGNRLLKEYINEPLLNIKEIEERQFAIEELIKNQNKIQIISNYLENFNDLSRICTKILNSTITPKELYIIANCSETIKKIASVCDEFQSNYLKIDKETLEDVLNISDEIKSAIKEDSGNSKDKNIIKEGYYPNLDYLKEKLKTVIDEIKQYEKQEQKRLEIENLKICNSKLLSYYIEIPNTKIHKISNSYHQKQKLSTSTRYSTEILQSLEEKYFNLTNQIERIEEELFSEIKKKSVNFIECLREISHEISKIDLFVSLSQCAIKYNWVKPEFNNEVFEIKGGYHPILLYMDKEIVKNDTSLSNNSIVILTGANMSGKSTYLKHNAIISILAQIGSFVPANYANLTITDRLFFRQGSTDDIINNNSSFMIEMNDLKFILDNITNSSLIFLDEPAKSTNYKEGGAIARAFCEYILNKYKAKTMIATHNSELTRSTENYKNKIQNYVINNDSRKLEFGIQKESYAINTAKKADLPQEIIDLAEKYINIT